MSRDELNPLGAENEPAPRSVREGQAATLGSAMLDRRGLEAAQLY